VLEMRIGPVLTEGRERERMAQMACDYGIGLVVKRGLVIQSEGYCEDP
jgi:hypothetical protein